MCIRHSGMPLAILAYLFGLSSSPCTGTSNAPAPNSRAAVGRSDDNHTTPAPIVIWVENMPTGVSLRSVVQKSSRVVSWRRDTELCRWGKVITGDSRAESVVNLQRNDETYCIATPTGVTEDRVHVESFLEIPGDQLSISWIISDWFVESRGIAGPGFTGEPSAIPPETRLSPAGERIRAILFETGDVVSRSAEKWGAWIVRNEISAFLKITNSRRGTRESQHSFRNLSGSRILVRGNPHLSSRECRRLIHRARLTGRDYQLAHRSHLGLTDDEWLSLRSISDPAERRRVLEDIYYVMADVEIRLIETSESPSDDAVQARIISSCEFAAAIEAFFVLDDSGQWRLQIENGGPKIRHIYRVSYH